MLAAKALAEAERARSKTHAKREIVRAVESVAKCLGNTKAVCRKCYIHPAVLHAFADGVTLSRTPIANARVPKGLLDSEARLVSLLRRPDRARKAA